MSSENYRIRRTVTSAGGVSTGSASYQTNATVGQPSPLMDPLDPPLSDTYDLYPGFWYAVMGPKCEDDYDGDVDVDGADLAVLASEFGRADCP